MKEINAILEEVANNKKKNSKSLDSFNCRAKGISGSNNLLVTCELFNRKGATARYYARKLISARIVGQKMIVW